MNPSVQKYARATGVSLVLLIFALKLIGQISPGDLSQPHAHLAGLSNCTKCHILGEKVSSEKCLECHLEIGVRISEKRGYHSSSEVAGKECIACHSDHHGKNFQMIRFDTDQFDHSLSGYDLHGAHSTINCSKCHKNEFITDQEIKKKTSTYLGLDQKCLSCHTDYHQGTLATDCASCHDFNAFKPAPKFDHNRAGFKLIGKHAEVDCAKCHKIAERNGKEIRQFKGIASGKCTDCHRDVHENKFGQNCTKCHSEVSFHQVKGMSTFNHSLTRYPLEGKHQDVKCASCHKTGYTKKLYFGRCTNCHADYHRREFVVQDKSPDCSECHSILGFDRSNFTIERHNESPFVLTGAHLATPCFECHKKNDRWSFREIGQKCNDCHKNVHESVLDKKYDPETTCLNCHKSSRWNDIEFDHTKTGYALEGAHLRQSCRSCHFKSDEQGETVQRFSRLSSNCTECHKDVHQDQFNEGSGTRCAKCHDYFNWKAGLFDHNQTKFPLDGKHKDVACAKCHKPQVIAQVTSIQYKLKSVKCESCH